METVEERLAVLEQTVRAYREFLTEIVGLLMEKGILSQEDLHKRWAGIISTLKAEQELRS